MCGCGGGLCVAGVLRRSKDDVFLEYVDGYGKSSSIGSRPSGSRSSLFRVAVMSDYMLRKMFFPAVVFAFGGGFFVGFVAAVYAAVTLFGTAAMPG